MKQTLLFTLLFFVSSYINGQESQDEIVEELVEYLCERSDELNKAKSIEDFSYIFDELAAKKINALPFSQRDEISTAVFLRLQRNCEEIAETLVRFDPNEAWSIVTEKQKSKASRKDLKDFKSRTSFYYAELDYVIQVKVEDGYWSDIFPDGTATRLKMEWLSKDSFVLIFESSTNEGRAQMSKPGDKYYYQILEKKENAFTLQSWIESQEQYYISDISFE